MRKTILVAALLALVLSDLACSSGQTDPPTQEPRTIKIGYFGDLSGPTFNFGQSSRNGVIMAADEVNQMGGVNRRRIDLVIEDDKGSPELAATIAARLINEEKVFALIAGGSSSISLAAAPKAQASGVPMISPSATNTAVTQVGDYIFRACFIDPFQGQVMARFAAHTLGAKKAAVLLDFNSPYSRDLREYFESSFIKFAGEIVSEQSYNQGDRDFRGQLNAIQTAQPDVIYIPGYYADVAVIAKQARALGITQPLLGGDGWDAPELWELGGDSLNGSYITNHYSIEDPSAVTERFIREYRNRYGNLTPDAHAALAYDAMRVLIEALQKTNGLAGPQLRDAIAATEDHAGVTGSITINAERNAVKPAVILLLLDKRYIYQETIRPDAVPEVTPEPSPSPKPKPRRRSRR